MEGVGTVVRIGIVDDDPAGREVMVAHLQRYQSEHQVQFAVRTFDNAQELVEGYRPEFDLLLLDVKMDEMDGFEAAHAIRTLDDRVVIVFVTNMAQFAIKGYEVDALSYLVKPVPYFAFSQELDRSLRRITKLGADSGTIMFPTAGGTARVDVADITYIESSRHRIKAHTLERTYTFTGTLKSLEAELDGQEFFRSNNCYIVNLRHVRGVNATSSIMQGGEELAVSRPRRRAFLDALANYVGGRT